MFSNRLGTSRTAQHWSIIHTRLWSSLHMREEPYKCTLLFIDWCMQKTQQNCGLRGFVKRLSRLCHLALFLSCALVSSFGCLSFQYLHACCSLLFRWSFGISLVIFIMCNHNWVFFLLRINRTTHLFAVSWNLFSSLVSLENSCSSLNSGNWD